MQVKGKKFAGTKKRVNHLAKMRQIDRETKSLEDKSDEEMADWLAKQKKRDWAPLGIWATRKGPTYAFPSYPGLEPWLKPLNGFGDPGNFAILLSSCRNIQIHLACQFGTRKQGSSAKSDRAEAPEMVNKILNALALLLQRCVADATVGRKASNPKAETPPSASFSQTVAGRVGTRSRLKSTRLTFY